MSLSKGVDLTSSELIDIGKLFSSNIRDNKYISSNHSGARRTKILGQGMDFNQIRQYQFGDDIRSIDWKSSARLQKTYIKIYKEERQRPIFLLIDLNNSMLFASKTAFKSVIAARLATFFAFLACQFDDKIGAIIYTQNHHIEIKPKSPKRAINLLICSLVELHQTALMEIDNNDSKAHPNTLEFALSRLNRATKSDSLAIIISDFFNFDDKAQVWIQRLAKRNQVLLNFVYDPLEQAPPKADDYWVNAAGSTQKMDIGGKHNRQIYRDFFAHKLAFLTRFANNNKIELRQTSTTIDLKTMALDL